MSPFEQFCIWFGQFVLTVLLADFLSGFFHWLEDAYGTPDTPVLGRIYVRPNIRHHHAPRSFLRHNWLQSSWDLLLVGIGIVLVAWWQDQLTWQVWLFVVLAANANQFHKWAHQTPAENGPVIAFLQELHLLQTPQQHAGHHTNPKNSCYCVLTNLTNPFLDGLRFWDGLEWLVWKLTGVRRRVDTSNPGNGPAPEWLSR